MRQGKEGTILPSSLVGEGPTVWGITAATLSMRCGNDGSLSRDKGTVEMEQMVVTFLIGPTVVAHTLRTTLGEALHLLWHHRRVWVMWYEEAGVPWKKP